MAADVIARDPIVDGAAGLASPPAADRERGIEALQSEVAALRAELHQLRERLELLELDRQLG
ncbi:MAG: hypothetical protein U1E83_02915 [Methylotetracoccus sp.]